MANRVHLARAAGISGQMPGHELQVGDEFVVVVAHGAAPGDSLPVNVHVDGKAGFDVMAAGRAYRITLANSLRELVLRGTVNGKPFVAQVERIGLAYRVMNDGAQIDAKVFTARAAELNALMPVKAPPDLSKFLLSPMPGLLAELSVAVGQAVRAGEKLAVIEAMKMENILLATADGVVSEIAARRGDSLAVDQVIIKFE